MFFQIARVIMLLPINNIHEKRNTVPKKVIQRKLLYYLFPALCYLEIALLLANLNRTKHFDFGGVYMEASEPSRELKCNLGYKILDGVKPNVM